MANHFWALDKGGRLVDVTDAAATQSKTVEVNVDLTTDSPNQLDVILALRNIEAYIEQHPWPPV
jgi:hypothetical protein